MSTSNKSAIFSKLVISGCDVFVHHFDTVDGLTPICSESHLLVRFFSTKTSLILFTSSIIASFDCKNNDYFSFSLLFGNKFINFTLEYLNQIGYMNIILQKAQKSIVCCLSGAVPFGSAPLFLFQGGNNHVRVSIRIKTNRGLPTLPDLPAIYRAADEG